MVDGMRTVSVVLCKATQNVTARHHNSFPSFILDSAIRQLSRYILQGNHCSPSSDDNTKHYVLPVLWVTSCFNFHHHNADRVTTESAARCAHFQRANHIFLALFARAAPPCLIFKCIQWQRKNSALGRSPSSTVALLRCGAVNWVYRDVSITQLFN